ncbi:MAG: phosphoserine transaminase [Pseudomonadota bacterium]
MMLPQKPDVRPANPHFSSGPCAKRPGWSLENLNNAVLGRSHRAKPGKARLKHAIDLTRELLALPDDYLCGIVPASDTGAYEMAMWTMLGARGVDALAWESFGKGWVTDAVKQLKLDDCRVMDADYGALPDLGAVGQDRDILFTSNGTTSGVRIPNYDWISADRGGLTFADATSAAFAQDIDWPKVDVCTFSWQKVMGGEAGFGMLILSPRAVERLESYTPSWPLPKIFRLTKGGKLIAGIFEGATINTPSMLAVEDYVDALEWGRSIGGLSELKARADRNAQTIWDWSDARDWIANLANEPATRSNTSVCLKIVDPAIAGTSEQAQAAFAKSLANLLEAEGVAYDIGAYRDAPPGLRIWTGSTVQQSDVAALLPWLDWAFETAKAEQAAAA